MQIGDEVQSKLGTKIFTINKCWSFYKYSCYNFISSAGTIPLQLSI